MAGAYYIWIMGAVFVGVCMLILGFFIMLRIGHWMEKNQTGSKHGFLELPPEMRSRPASTANLESRDSTLFQYEDDEAGEEHKGQKEGLSENG